MKLSMAIGGRTHEIDPDASGAQVATVAPGVYSVLLDGRSYEARVEQSDAGVIVFIAGHRFEVEMRGPERGPRLSGARRVEGRSSIAAPMPGKVVRLLVAEGDAVTAGQGLLVVEAMKMQNEMKAPQAGRVVSLTAREGATVAAGEVLAAIE